MKAIDRRIRMLEALHPKQDIGTDPPRWLIEGKHNKRIFDLLRTVAAYEHQDEYGGLYAPPQAAKQMRPGLSYANSWGKARRRVLPSTARSGASYRTSADVPATNHHL